MRHCIWMIVPFVICALATGGPASAILDVNVLDGATGQGASCNILITGADGRSLVEPAPSLKGVRCGGKLRRQLPPGPIKIRVTRGFETPAVEKELVLREGTVSTVDVRLDRTIDLRSRGWYSGDSHTHMIHGERTVEVGFDDVAIAAQAEDLAYLSLGQTWTVASPTPEALEAELARRSVPGCLLTWSLEAPKNYYRGDATRCLGHCWSVGMSGRTKEQHDVIQLLMAVSAHDYEVDKPTYANFESHALIRKQGGAVFYTHPLRWWEGPWGGRAGYPRQEKARISNLAVELPLDVLIGPTFDGLDVITGTGERQADEGAFNLWSMLLNHGYRLTPTASSDSCFDRPHGALPGAARTYTLVTDGFALAKVKEATRRGATFATTGPLLLVSIDGRPPGSELKAGDVLHRMVIEAWASGEDPGGLTRLEIIRNGQLFKDIPVNSKEIREELNISEKENAWYCVRAAGTNPDKQRAISGAFYFVTRDYGRPVPIPVTAKISVVDAASGRKVSAEAEEVFFEGTHPRAGESHQVPSGEAVLRVPGTARLKVRAEGYREQTLSPFVDNPRLVELITGLAAEDLLTWKTFERVREELDTVELTFRLERSAKTKP